MPVSCTYASRQGSVVEIIVTEAVVEAVTAVAVRLAHVDDGGTGA